MRLLLYVDSMFGIRKNEDFRLVYKAGKSYANKYLVLYVLKKEQENCRIGISVSKKIGNSVVRHRIKRLIKECCRLHEDEIYCPADSSSVPCGADIVAVGRRSANGASYHEIERALLSLLKSSGMYHPKKENDADEDHKDTE